MPAKEIKWYPVNTWTHISLKPHDQVTKNFDLDTESYLFLLCYWTIIWKFKEVFSLIFNPLDHCKEFSKSFHSVKHNWLWPFFQGHKETKPSKTVWTLNPSFCFPSKKQHIFQKLKMIPLIPSYFDTYCT